MSSLSRAALSYSWAPDAIRISRSSRLTCVPLWPAMNELKSSTMRRCSSGLTRPTHGAEHLPMYPNRHGRPICALRRKTPAEQERIGKTLSSRSTVSRIAQACEYGPKYRTPFFLGPRPTMTRGKSSLTVIASHG